MLFAVLHSGGGGMSENIPHRLEGIAVLEGQHDEGNGGDRPGLIVLQGDKGIVSIPLRRFWSCLRDFFLFRKAWSYYASWGFCTGAGLSFGRGP